LPRDRLQSAAEPGAAGYWFLLKNEDYLAVWLAGIILLFGLLVVFGSSHDTLHATIQRSNATLAEEAKRAPFKTIAWHQASNAKISLRGSNIPIITTLNEFLARPASWSDKPLSSFLLSEADANARRAASKEKFEASRRAHAEALTAAQAAENAAAAAGFEDPHLNMEARARIEAWRKTRSAELNARSAAEARPFNYFTTLFVLMISMGGVFSAAVFIMGRPVKDFLLGFPAVFLIATLSYWLAANAQLRAWGLEYVLWAIILGFLISNTVGTPKAILAAAQTEFYIKTGLVLLGSTILMNKILLIGIPGIFVTWVVTPCVLVGTFWFGQKILKMESASLNITISADMSVSGVSAAIAAAAASRAKTEELTLAVGISIIFTAVMMVIMPMAINAIGMHPVLGGAWIGGTVDSTGAVVAAGEMLGPVARDVAATVKMIQNIMIGLMAFGVAAYWCLRVDRSRAAEADLSFRGAAREVWNRFPKFVLGFIGASVLFSILYASMNADAARVLIDDGVIRGLASPIQAWLFALAFASIGLSTNFRKLSPLFKSGKPVILYICGQSFNLILTLAVAYIMFFVIFPNITESLMK
jgi:uncharacterized membrane protein YadS